MNMNKLNLLSQHLLVLPKVGPPLDQYARPGAEESVPQDAAIIEYAACPACGNPIDYCDGHGVIGDPILSLVLVRHDTGDHSCCHPMGCPESTAQFGVTR